jgi:hypothetical protein
MPCSSTSTPCTLLRQAEPVPGRRLGGNCGRTLQAEDNSKPAATASQPESSQRSRLHSQAGAVLDKLAHACAARLSNLLQDVNVGQHVPGTGGRGAKRAGSGCEMVVVK